MRKHPLSLMGAAVAGAMLVLPAVAQTQSYDSGKAGVTTPRSVSEAPAIGANVPAGQPVIPRANDPMNPNESRPFVQSPEGVRPLAGDNPRMPNPQTPSAANESAPQPRLVEPTNRSGMEGGAAVGATAVDANRSGTYDSGDRGIRTPAAVSVNPARRVPEAGPGVPTLPERNNPASVSESAPQKTGKEVSSAPVPDNKRMANPQTPANVSESAPARTGQEQLGVGGTR